MASFLRSRAARRLPRARAPLIVLLMALYLTGCTRGASALDSSEPEFLGQRFRVVQIDLKRDALSLYWRNPETEKAFGSIDALQQWGARRHKRLLFAANAGIYDRKFAPLGLHVENGKTLVPLNLAHGDPTQGNFSLRPNGVFSIDSNGRAEITTTAAFKAQNLHPQSATQSGPMLVIDGKINDQFVNDSSSLKWRSGVCAKTPTKVVFVVSETPVNFYTFARLFRDKLGCRNALYLDGSISQFYLDGNGYAGAPSLTLKPYAGIFAVFVDS